MIRSRSCWNAGRRGHSSSGDCRPLVSELSMAKGEKTNRSRSSNFSRIVLFILTFSDLLPTIDNIQLDRLCFCWHRVSEIASKSIIAKGGSGYLHRLTYAVISEGSGNPYMYLATLRNTYDAKIVRMQGKVAALPTGRQA